MTIPVQEKTSASPVFLRAAAKVAFVLILVVIEVSCGETYRPVAQVIPQPPPNPAAFHFVISVSTNGAFDPGAASRIDVSGDSTVGVFQTGAAPAHAALIPNGTRLYVANSAEDTVTANNTPTPTVATTISLPPPPQGAPSLPCPPNSSPGCVNFPVFVHTTENGNVYVANYAGGTVSVINTTSNVVTATVSVGTHPVVLAELPNAQKLYVANQGSGDVSVISTVDDSVKPLSIPVGSSPVWAVARSDSARVYVLDSSGVVYDIDTLSDTVKATGSTGGAGANFMLYDSTSNSLLVTNSGSGTLSVLDAAADPPSLRANSPISIPAPAIANPCQGAPVVPSAATILPDGRAYVASFQLSSGRVCTQSSVIDTAAGAVTKTIPLAQAADLSTQTGCASAGFRVFTVSSGGGSTSNFKVYVSQCDAGNVAVIDTFPSGSNPQDTFNGVSLPAPLSSFPAPSGSQIPPPQNPVLVVAGP
jgi:YVTN family beta-propeller protein